MKAILKKIDNNRNNLLHVTTSFMITSIFAKLGISVFLSCTLVFLIGLSWEIVRKKYLKIPIGIKDLTLNSVGIIIAIL